MMRRLHSAPKPSPRVCAIHVAQRLSLGAHGVADAIVARQVGAGLGRADDVVARDGVLGGGQADFANLAAQLFQHIDAACDQIAGLAGQALRSTRAAARSSGRARCRPVARRNRAPARRPTWNRIRRGRRWSAEPVPRRAPFARTGRYDRANWRRPPGRSATRGHRSASRPPRRRTTPAGGRIRRCRNRAQPPPYPAPPPPPSRRSNRPARGPAPRDCAPVHKAEFSFDEPMANSSQLVLPMITPPACSSRITAVASYGGM